MKTIFISMLLVLSVACSGGADSGASTEDASVEQGPAGPQGEQGIQGQAGADGKDGTNGSDGSDGKDGAVGATGPKGDKGDTGVGSQGIQGIAGLAGQQGAQGNQGIQGLQGPAGLQGLKGDKGDKGDTGAKGDKGDTGSGFAKSYIYKLTAHSTSSVSAHVACNTPFDAIVLFQCIPDSYSDSTLIVPIVGAEDNTSAAANLTCGFPSTLYSTDRQGTAVIYCEGNQ